MAEPRWLRKSLYETGERLQGVLLLFLQSRAEPAQTAKDALSLAADVYEREIITTHHLEQLLYTRTDALQLHDLEWLTTDQPYNPRDFERLVWDFADARQQTCGMLWSLSPHQWDRHARHSFMGDVSVEALTGRLHQCDLEHLVRATHLLDATTGPRTRA